MGEFRERGFHDFPPVSILRSHMYGFHRDVIFHGVNEVVGILNGQHNAARRRFGVVTNHFQETAPCDIHMARNRLPGRTGMAETCALQREIREPKSDHLCLYMDVH